MKNTLLASFLATTVFVSQSLAGINEVRICAEKLPEAAQKVFRAVAPKLKPGVNARRVMKSTVISMVRSGEIDRPKAKSSAQAAGRCLKKWRD